MTSEKVLWPGTCDDLGIPSPEPKQLILLQEVWAISIDDVPASNHDHEVVLLLVMQGQALVWLDNHPPSSPTHPASLQDHQGWGHYLHSGPVPDCNYLGAHGLGQDDRVVWLEVELGR